MATVTKTTAATAAAQFGNFKAADEKAPGTTAPDPVVCLEIGDKVQATKLYNHWGLDVASRDEVDAAYEAALRLQDEYGIRRVNKIQMSHGDYTFKLQDRDGNWWEIQYIEEPMKYDKRFARGDIIPT